MSKEKRKFLNSRVYLLIIFFFSYKEKLSIFLTVAHSRGIRMLITLVKFIYIYIYKTYKTRVYQPCTWHEERIKKKRRNLSFYSSKRKFKSSNSIIYSLSFASLLFFLDIAFIKKHIINFLLNGIYIGKKKRETEKRRQALRGNFS